MAETQWKCSRCKCVKTSNGFGLNRKNERNKTCIHCNKQRITYNKSKKEFDFDIKDNQWVQHPIHKNYYCNSNGIIVNGKTKNMIGKLNNDGYIGLGLCDDGETIFKQAHVFIWESFKGPIPDKMIINHKDENKSNNNINNLEVVTNSENSLYSSSNNKSTRKAKSVIGYDAELEERKLIYFCSLKEASRQLNICSPSIQKVCDGIQNTCTSKLTEHKWNFKYFNQATRYEIKEAMSHVITYVNDYIQA